MTNKDKEAIHRMLGQIEGVAFMIDDRAAEPILNALEIIDDILNREDGADNE